MGGYNTICELLTIKKRAIIVPSTKPVQEQWIRADRLAQRSVFRALHPDEMTPQKLMSMVTEELANNNVHSRLLYQVDMNGLNNIQESINLLLDDRGSGEVEWQYPIESTS